MIKQQDKTHHKYTQTNRRVDLALVSVSLAYDSPKNEGSATLVPLTTHHPVLSKIYGNSSTSGV